MNTDGGLEKQVQDTRRYSGEDPCGPMELDRKYTKWTCHLFRKTAKHHSSSDGRQFMGLEDNFFVE